MRKLSRTNWLDSEQKILGFKTDGKNLVKLTEYQNIALWWFIRFRLYHAEESNRLARLLMKHSFLFSFVDFLYDLLTSILCKLISTFFKAKADKKGPKVLMVTHNVQWRRIRGPTGASRKCDIYLDPIIKELKKRGYTPVTISPLKYSVSAVKIMIERLKVEDVIHREFNAYWSPKIWSRQFHANRYFRNIWKNLSKKDNRFVTLLNKHPLTSEMPYYFNSLFGHIVKQIEMAKEVVREQAPDLILVTSEYGFSERSLLVAGKLDKIPILAVQHGNIGPLHEGYIYSRNSISASGSIKSPYCPVPDKTAVYGPFYYKILTKTSAYPPASVVVTGQPRYDKLVMANRIFSREEFCTKLGLAPSRKIALVATQGWPMRETFIRKVLGALKEFPEVQIVIKPHPRENSQLYKRVVDEQNVTAKILSKSWDTVEALCACDLLVAAFSTVITEALVLGKPVVTVNLTAADPAPYYKKVTLRVDKKEDLIPAIAKMLQDQNTREKIRKAGKEFSFNHTYKQDGRATERVVNLVEGMIREKTP